MENPGIIQLLSTCTAVSMSHVIFTKESFNHDRTCFIQTISKLGTFEFSHLTHPLGVFPLQFPHVADLFHLIPDHRCSALKLGADEYVKK